MAETAILAGHGPGFCESFADRLGASEYDVALIARSDEYLTGFASELRNAGYSARVFPGDLTNPEEAKDILGEISRELGPVSVIAHTASTVTQSNTRNSISVDSNPCGNCTLELD
jgi:short-subunit dehydrogenase